MAVPALRTLIAAPVVVGQTLARALDGLGVEAVLGKTTAEAEAHLATPFNLILVCYVFDDVRPYRFIRKVRTESANPHTPVVLVRALPVPLGETQEWEIRQSYKSIGVNDFVNYSQLVHDKGTAPADEALRECVFKLLRLQV